MLEYFFLQFHLVIKVIHCNLALVVFLEANHHMVQICVLAAIQLTEGNHFPEALLEDKLLTDAIECSFEFEEPYLSIEESDE